MIIQCHNCQSRYRLSEEKISGPEVKVLCKKCKEVIVVQRPSPPTNSLSSSPGLLDVMSPPLPQEPKIDNSGISSLNAGQEFQNHQRYVDPSALSAEDICAGQEAMNDSQTQTTEEAGDMVEEEPPSIFDIPSAEEGISIFEDSLSGLDLDQETALDARDETGINQEQPGSLGLMEELNNMREQQMPARDVAEDPDSQSNEASTGFSEDALEEALEDSIEDAFDDLPDEEEQEEKYEVKIQEKAVNYSVVKIAFRLLVLLSFIIGLSYILFQEGSGLLETVFSEYFPKEANEKSDNLAAQAFTLNNLRGYPSQGSEQTGRIFVISGDVKNQTTSAKNFVQLKGKIIGPYERPVAEKTVYGGNTFTKRELATFSKEEIEAQLQTKMGRSLVNFNIQAGSQVSFMIVFFDVPGDVEVINFQVEVTAWQKGVE